MRAAFAVAIAAVAIAVSLPAEVVPWARGLRMGMATWWPAWTTTICLTLALAGRLLPPPPLEPRGRDFSGLTVGLLLVLEPFLHLAVLGVCAARPTAFGAEALLPAGWRRPAIDGAFVVRLVVLTVLVPVCEEYFFRGRLLAWLRARLGAFSAVSITALGFAVAHGDLVQVAVALPVGILLGAMRLAGADLGACMVAHAVHNGLFLFGGAGLVALPWIGPALAAAGAGLASLAWCLHLRPRRGGVVRATLVTVLAAVLVLAAMPLHRALLDRWYVAGVHQLLVWWRIGNGELFARLVQQERNGRLTPARSAALAQRLLALPCQTLPRQAGALAVLAPASADDALEDAGYDLLYDLRSGEAPSAEAARRVARRWPQAFVAFALEYPETLPRWLPLPQALDAVVAQLVATADPRERRQLLGALEQAQPGRVADALLALPASAVTPIDARHLRLHYPDWRERLSALAAQDPQRAGAFGY